MASATSRAAAWSPPASADTSTTGMRRKSGAAGDGIEASLMGRGDVDDVDIGPRPRLSCDCIDLVTKCKMPAAPSSTPPPSSTPRYARIAQILRSRLEAHDGTREGPFATEQALCAEFGVSRTTVRHALGALKRE